MREEPLFRPVRDNRAPGLRTVSLLETLTGGVPLSDCSGAFYRVLPGEPRSRTASGQDYRAGYSCT